MKTIVVAWTNAGGRSTALADGLDAEIYNIESGLARKSWNGPVRYLVQSVKTAKALLASKPDQVIVQNPPIVTAAVVFGIQKVFRSCGELIIDSHTGAFLDPRWSRYLFLHRWLSRRAKSTLVHNSSQAKTISEWGVPWLLVPYVKSAVLESGLEGAEIESGQAPVVFAVCSGGYDEPIDEMAEAAKAMPDVVFEVTGRSERIRARLSGQVPENMRLLDLLPFDEYLKRMGRASAILTLTTRENTLLNGGFEAIALRKPLITTDTDVLREYFCRGTVHTANDGRSIASAIEAALGQLDRLNAEMSVYSEECDAEWEKLKRSLLGLDG